MVATDEDLVARADARLGALLNEKYTLDRVLGIGGMATVYAATHRNGKEFAVKVLHAELSMRAETRTRFLREGYLANRISHPGAVAVLDDDIAEDGAAFLVMELLQGQTVEAIWEANRCRLPLPFVAGVGLQLLDVLAAAHARGLVHRDIKPGNLMLTPEGTLKVLDFGIARLRDMAHAHTTQTGMVLGTPAFMAPEHAMAKSDEIDAQTDLWAVGATLFTLATGELVHEADNTQQLLVKAATVPARSITKLLPRAPEAVTAVIDLALSFDKGARWRDATAMQNALREAARHSFNGVPTAAVLAQMLDELSEQHEKTNEIARTQRPPAQSLEVDASVDPEEDDEMVTGSRAAAARSVGQSTAELDTGPALAAPRAVERPAPLRPPGATVLHQAPPAVGMITTEAMATDSSMRRTVSRPGGFVAAAMAIAVLGIALVLVFVMRSGSDHESSTAGSAAHPTTEAPPATAFPAPVPTETAEPAAPMDSAASIASSKARAVHLVPPPASVPMVPPRPHPVATAAPVAASPASPPSKPSCNPPYEFDESGNKHWKRECL